MKKASKREVVDHVSRAFDVPKRFLTTKVKFPTAKVPPVAQLAKLFEGMSKKKPALLRTKTKAWAKKKAAHPERGLAYDMDKLPWHLVPWDVIELLVLVYLYGCIKYAPRNWEKGIAWSRRFSSTIRHIVAWWLGEDYDKSGLHHLDQAIWNVVTLRRYSIDFPELDDRPKGRLAHRRLVLKWIEELIRTWKKHGPEGVPKKEVKKGGKRRR
jgi:hypothetical protein